MTATAATAPATHTVTLALPATLTMASAAAAQRTLTADIRQALQAQPGAGLTLDAAALVQFDSAALALLLAARRCAQQLGAPVSIAHWPAQLRQLAAAYGVLELLDPCAQP